MACSAVESDYTVVFFAAGGRHTPGWNWVWKAYRSLSRKYRKNLKRLVSDSFHSINIEKRAFLYSRVAVANLYKDLALLWAFTYMLAFIVLVHRAFEFLHQESVPLSGFTFTVF